MYTFAKSSYLIIVFKRLRPNQKPDGICFCSLRCESPGLQVGRTISTHSWSHLHGGQVGIVSQLPPIQGKSQSGGTWMLLTQFCFQAA